MKTTKYVTPEQAIQCADKAQKVSAERNYIENDDARAYVMAHHELRDEIVTAQKLMYLARYELELSVALGEVVDNSNDTHYDRSFDYPIKADKHRDKAMDMLADAEIDRDAREYLTGYLHDLTTI